MFSGGCLSTETVGIMAASTRRTLKIEEIRNAESLMFWFDRLTMFLILSFSYDRRTSDFLEFAFAACFLVFTHYNYVVLYLERRRIGHPYSSEVDAKFNRLAFYGERIGFLVVILWLALGWPFAFEMTLLLFAFINGLYMLRYQKLQDEEYARTRTTDQESENTEADAAVVEENKQSESENKVQEEEKPVQTDKDNKSEELKTYEDNQRLSSFNEIDLYRRLTDAKLRIKVLQDQCVEHNKEKEDLTTTLDRVTKSLYIFSKNLTRLRQENSDLVTQLSEANSWYEFQVRTTLDYENRNTILKLENKNLQHSLQLLNELKSSYKFYKSCYESMEEDYMKLMEEKIELSAKLAAKVDAQVVDEMEENCRRLEQEKTELMYKNSAEKFAAEAAVSELEIKCESLEQENAELMSDAKFAAEAVNELEVKCESLKQEKILLLYEISATKRVYDEDVNELKDKSERLEQENTDLMSEVSAAKIYRSYLHDLDDDDLIIVD